MTGGGRGEGVRTRTSPLTPHKSPTRNHRQGFDQSWFLFSFMNHWGALLEAQWQLAATQGGGNGGQAGVRRLLTTAHDILRAWDEHWGIAAIAAQAATTEMGGRGVDALRLLQGGLLRDAGPLPDAAALLPKLDRLASIAADGVRMQAGIAYFLRFEHFKGNCLRSGQQHDAAAVAAAPAAARHYLQGALCYHQMQMQMQHYIHAASAWRQSAAAAAPAAATSAVGVGIAPSATGPAVRAAAPAASAAEAPAPAPAPAIDKGP